MKILSGTFKGRLLKSPKSDKTRPTSSKVRGSIFDQLQQTIEGTRFLDLFAGSGAMGIEALSRGAKEATFVEMDKRAASCIRENLESLQVSGCVIQKDAVLAASQLVKQNAQFDIIFADPPYSLDLTPLLPHLPDLLAGDGILLIEQDKRAKLSLPTLIEEKPRSFGDTLLFVFKKSSST